MELRFISLLGWFTMIAVAWAISYNRKLFPWRTVIWGLGLQLALAVLILKTDRKTSCRERVFNWV